jgi:hypothetical protein
MKDLAIYRNDYPLLSRSKPLAPKAATLEALIISKIFCQDDGTTAKVLLDQSILSKYGICDTRNRNFMKDLEDLKTQLLTYEVELPDDPRYKIRWRSLITQFDVFQDNTVSIGVDPDLAPYLVGLKKHFTILDVIEVATLSNQYAKKLYMLLKTVEFKGGGTFSFDEIKQSLGVQGIKTYQKFYIFNDKILKKAIQELNDVSDIYINWTAIRHGRSVGAIEFTLGRNPKHQPRLPMVDNITDTIPHEIRVFMDSYGFNDDNFIEALIAATSGDLLLEATQLFDKRMANTSIKNKAGLYRLRVHRYIEQVLADRKRKVELEEALLGGSKPNGTKTYVKPFYNIAHVSY